MINEPSPFTPDEYDSLTALHAAHASILKPERQMLAPLGDALEPITKYFHDILDADRSARIVFTTTADRLLPLPEAADFFAYRQWKRKVTTMTYALLAQTNAAYPVSHQLLTAAQRGECRLILDMTLHLPPLWRGVFDGMGCAATLAQLLCVTLQIGVGRLADCTWQAPEHTDLYGIGVVLQVEAQP